MTSKIKFSISVNGALTQALPLARRAKVCAHSYTRVAHGKIDVHWLSHNRYCICAPGKPNCRLPKHMLVIPKMFAITSVSFLPMQVLLPSSDTHNIDGNERDQQGQCVITMGHVSVGAIGSWCGSGLAPNGTRVL